MMMLVVMLALINHCCALKNENTNDVDDDDDEGGVDDDDDHHTFALNTPLCSQIQLPNWQAFDAKPIFKSKTPKLSIFSLKQTLLCWCRAVFALKKLTAMMNLTKHNNNNSNNNIVVVMTNLKAAVATGSLSFKFKPGSLYTPLAHLCTIELTSASSWSS